MHDLHFATNDICMAARLAKFAGKHFATNDICIAPRLANLALKSTGGLMKRKHTQKKGGAVGAMPPTHYLSKPVGGGGGVAYKDGAGLPPP